LTSLKQIIEDNSTRRGRAVDLSIQLLIVLSLIAFSVETLPDQSERTLSFLKWFEVLTVGVFTVEYLLRIAVADRRLRFIFSFFGLIDLLAILPFYLSTGVDLRSIRVFRLLRLFRAFKLMRYSKAIQRFHRAFLIAREEIVLFFCVAIMLLYFASVGIYYCENQAQPDAFASVFHSLWWAFVTMTTVGYGDVVPITLGGRLFTCLFVLISLGVVSAPAGMLASALMKARQME
jgi:voltage-gated potassium channel